MTTLRDALARSLTDLTWLGLPASTMISPWLAAKVFGVLDSRLASVTVVMFVGLAEAKTSACRALGDLRRERGTAVVVELHRDARIGRLELIADLVEGVGQ